MSDRSAWRTSDQFHRFGITLLICEAQVWHIWWFRAISWISVWTDFSFSFILKWHLWFSYRFIGIFWSLLSLHVLDLGKTVQLPNFDRNDVSNRSGQDLNLNILCFAEAFFNEWENLFDYIELFFTRTPSLSRTWLYIQSFWCLKLTSGEHVLEISAVQRRWGFNVHQNQQVRCENPWNTGQIFDVNYVFKLTSQKDHVLVVSGWFLFWG